MNIKKTGPDIPYRHFGRWLTNSHISGFVTEKYTQEAEKCLCSGTELLLMSRSQQEPVQLVPYRLWLEAGTLNLPIM